MRGCWHGSWFVATSARQQGVLRAMRRACWAACTDSSLVAVPLRCRARSRRCSSPLPANSAVDSLKLPARWRPPGKSRTSSRWGCLERIRGGPAKPTRSPEIGPWARRSRPPAPRSPHASGRAGAAAQGPADPVPSARAEPRGLARGAARARSHAHAGDRGRVSGLRGFQIDVGPWLTQGAHHGSRTPALTAAANRRRGDAARW